MIHRFAAAALAALAALAPALAQERVVNIFNWSDYIDPAVLEDFTRETGIAAVYDTYDTNEMAETKLFAGDSGYDIVVPSAPNLARQIQAKTIRPLDKAKLPNLVHIWPFIAGKLQPYDPGNAHAVNYMWGTTGIGYNAAKVKERLPDGPLDSWALLFDPANAAKLADCGITVLDTPEELIPAALHYLGLNPDSKDEAEITKAGEALKAIRPYIQKFTSSAYIDDLANGDICLAVGYSGDVFIASDRATEAGNGVEVEYVIPKEGAAMWFDSFVIPSEAPHPEEAYAFIDYMLRPEIAARNSEHVFYASGNKDAQPLLSEEIVGDPRIYPDEEMLGRLYTTTPYAAGIQRFVTRLWTDLKAGG